MRQCLNKFGTNSGYDGADPLEIQVKSAAGPSGGGAITWEDSDLPTDGLHFDIEM
jgi:hypothetical protein